MSLFVLFLKLRPRWTKLTKLGHAFLNAGLRRHGARVLLGGLLLLRDGSSRGMVRGIGVGRGRKARQRWDRCTWEFYWCLFKIETAYNLTHGARLYFFRCKFSDILAALLQMSGGSVLV